MVLLPNRLHLLHIQPNHHRCFDAYTFYWASSLVLFGGCIEVPLFHLDWGDYYRVVHLGLEGGGTEGGGRGGLLRRGERHSRTVGSVELLVGQLTSLVELVVLNKSAKLGLHPQ